MREEDFFRNGLPCDTCRFGVAHPHNTDDPFAHILLNNTGVLNHCLNHRKYTRLNWRKWFSLRNGIKSVVRSVSLSYWPFFTGFVSPHLAVAYEKRAFEELWMAEPEALDATCRRRFRTMADVSQLAARSWRLARGHFTPAKPLGVTFFLKSEYGARPAAQAIAAQRWRMVCVNDDDTGFDFETERQRLIDAFERILPNKCSFER